MAAASEPRVPRVAILGTGLIGGSFGLALKKYAARCRVVGWDKEAALQQAQIAGAIDEGSTDLAPALTGANLVYVALPIGVTLEKLPEIARHVAPHALVTDACSTKAAVCQAAARHFSDPARFLGGHPLAGREFAGVEHSDAELFRGAKYALISGGDADSPSDGRVRDFTALLEIFGAQPVWLDAETHDWAVAIISHLPQMVSVALAGVVREETDETGLPLTLAARGLRNLLRLAGSPYPMWRDVALTNRENLARALDRMTQALEHLRERLASRELEDEFTAANEVYKILHDLQ